MDSNRLNLEEITYSALLDRICKKMAIDQCKKRLNFRNIPLVVKPKRQLYILDNEDVFIYLTSVDKDQRRSIMHVEGITEVKKVPIIEKLLRTEKASSDGGNYSELSSGLPKIEANPVVVILYNAIEKAEQHLKVQELRENVVIPYEQDVGIGLVNVENVEKVVNKENVGSHVCSCAKYVDLPFVFEEIRLIQEWEDQMGIEIGREFLCKEAVKYLIDRTSTMIEHQQRTALGLFS